MLQGYDRTGKCLASYDLMALRPSQVLAITTINTEILFVSTLPTSGRIFVNDTPCLTEVLVRRRSLVDIPGVPIDESEQLRKLATCMVIPGQHWVYQISYSSSSVETIDLYQMMR